MTRSFIYFVLFAAFGLLVTACTQGKLSGPKADYQAPVSALAPPANVAAICYDENDLAVYRARMVQQELVVGVLGCQGADGSRTYEARYNDFIKKFGPELPANYAGLKDLSARKHANIDVMVTEIANRTANQSSTDRAYCSRHERALAWALQPQVKSLSEVPPPYDFGPEMNVFSCPHN